MSGQIVAYVRVSSAEQNEARQVEALAGADRVFMDKMSGKSAERPALSEMLTYVREGDTVRVASLDRLARNLDDLRRLVDALVGKGVRVEFVKEGLSFTDDESAMSKLLLSVMGAFAEFERSLIRERQAEGIAIAKTKGVYAGRKPRLTPETLGQAQAWVAGGVPKAEVARRLGVSRQTLYNALSPAPKA
ncbi:recombinase family protein [Nocardioides flavescens]|uniref:Helix-turn-helix domain-containing protein n=1 Tax=Nocardioides flavescens TaxID=2691959 RepID=A0A6L7F062_9ACTN|nr:helix-turn-helix domain-containing protein [Nocardioides flavescens]